LSNESKCPKCFKPTGGVGRFVHTPEGTFHWDCFGHPELYESNEIARRWIATPWPGPVTPTPKEGRECGRCGKSPQEHAVPGGCPDDPHASGFVAPEPTKAEGPYYYGVGGVLNGPGFINGEYKHLHNEAMLLNFAFSQGASSRDARIKELEASLAASSERDAKAVSILSAMLHVWELRQPEHFNSNAADQIRVAIAALTTAAGKVGK